AKKHRDTSSKDEALGTAAVAHAAPQLSFTPPVAHGSDISSSPDPGNLGFVCFSSPSDAERDTWLLDSGAPDHMTFDAKDFTQTSLPKRTNIANANGVISPVTGAGTVTLTPTLQLPNTLLVPSLSHKLLSGETGKEESKWMELDWPGLAEVNVVPMQSVCVPQAPKHQAVNYQEVNHEATVSSPSVVPEDPTPENDPEVSSLNANIIESPTGYVLPHRHNRGKPPSRYSPDIEERRSRYPIANYVSTKGLTEPLKTSMHEISTHHVPTKRT
ncbi:Retrovirus-related Pol polyprotein from transposon RE1, partial [Fagus crenata]